MKCDATLRLLRAAALFASVFLPHAAYATQASEFSFAVIGQVIKSANDAAPLERAIAESDADNLAFVVVDGFKHLDEACSDELYGARLDLLSNAKNGVVFVPGGADWAECRDSSGRPLAVERIARLRELFFVDDFSLGASRIPLLRESSVPKFRSYGENARWEIGNVMFVALNLPADNNHFRFEAGRNSEFEDRLIANRDWLKRVFAIATRRKMSAVVFFCDGSPFARTAARPAYKRDGFLEVRQQLNALAEHYGGKVLVIHNRGELAPSRSGTPATPPSTLAPHIAWHENIGDLEVGAEWLRVSLRPGNPTTFGVSRGAAGK